MKREERYIFWEEELGEEAGDEGGAAQDQAENVLIKGKVDCLH